MSSSEPKDFYAAHQEFTLSQNFAVSGQGYEYHYDKFKEAGCTAALLMVTVSPKSPRTGLRNPDKYTWVGVTGTSEQIATFYKELGCKSGRVDCILDLSKPFEEQFPFNQKYNLEVFSFKEAIAKHDHAAYKALDDFAKDQAIGRPAWLGKDGVWHFPMKSPDNRPKAPAAELV